MDIELIKRMMDACYQGKRIRDMLPPLPDGVASSFIQYLDIIEKLEKEQLLVGTHGQYTPAIGAALFYVKEFIHSV